jgi:hypothetical protein
MNLKRFITVMLTKNINPNSESTNKGFIIQLKTVKDKM